MERYLVNLFFPDQYKHFDDLMLLQWKYSLFAKEIYCNTPMIPKVSQALGLHDFDILANPTMLIYL